MNTYIAWSDYEIEDFTTKQKFEAIKAPEFSEWQCHLFGHIDGISFTPLKGLEPNWFHRKMQPLILGHVWVKKSVTIRDTK
jgi:hypothetical protein